MSVQCQKCGHEQKVGTCHPPRAIQLCKVDIELRNIIAEYFGINAEPVHLEKKYPEWDPNTSRREGHEKENA